MKLSLTDYMSSYHDFKDYQQTFYVMDKTLKYIHENNYKVYSFNPDNIFLLNLIKNFSFLQDLLISEPIYIILYNTINNLTIFNVIKKHKNYKFFIILIYLFLCI